MIIERQRSGISSAGVTLAEAKAACRVTFSDDDDEITRNVSAATREIEEAASIAIIEHTIKLVLDEWTENGEAIVLPIGPVQSVTSVTADGDAFTDFELAYGEVRLLSGIETPEGEIVVTYVAGYGSDDTTTPDDLREAILHQVMWIYDRLETDKRGQALSPFTLRTIGRYRKVSL